LAAISEIRTTTTAPIIQRILDKGGATMMQKGARLAWPTFASQAPILAAGTMVGTAEVEASMRPLLAEVASVAIGSLLLAIAAYFAFARLPLGALDRTLGALEAANDRFRRQNVLLDAALANMAQGLAMYDAEARIVIANDRYSSLYGIDPDLVRPGTTLREIIELRTQSGLYAGRSVEEMYKTMRDRLETKAVSHVVNRMPDGRTIFALVQPRADGGWVVTHEDVTEREALAARLAQQNRLLREREEELEAQNTRFNAAINNMSQGMCLFDAEQRVVFANRRFAEVYALTPEEVKPGTTLREILTARAARGVYSHLDDQFIADGIASFRQEVSQIVPLADGRFISVVRRPMADGGVVSTHEDVTERETLSARLAEQNTLLRRQEDELKAQNECFDAALKNMSHGLCMFDAEQRVLVANQRYAEIYGLTPEQVRPGTTLRQIVEHRIARGLFAGANPEAYIKERLASFDAASVSVHRLSDGRAISIARRPMRGGGWVTTHEDITERQALNARLEQQHLLLKQQEEKLRQQNLRLDAALNNMVQGLAMFDGELRLVIANDRYAEIYGLAPEQVKPGTTLQAILQYRVANGSCCNKSADEMLQAMLRRAEEQESSHYATTLADGRHIAVSLQRMAEGGIVSTHQDITDQRRSEAKIVHMALHDALTDLPNRVLLNERLELALARVRRGEMVAVHLLDLDHFKTVNDTLGHPTGDKLLKQVTARLRALVRETDTIARMGGDEFAVLQTGITQPADATALALRIIEAVSEYYDLDGSQVVIGTSVGIAVGPADGVSPDQLIRNSDLALYRAKGDGRGTYRFFGPEMDAQMQVRRSMESDLRKALAAGEFELHYQPVVNLASNEVSGVEALIRWRHPAKGLIPPNSFIPVAEEIGFIVPLGEWAIREACRAARHWPDNIKVAVNLSPIQFRNPGFVSVVIAALAQTGLSADRLELEITESTLLQDSEATLSTLYQLRALGVRIAMDDFGTGYSSLSYLQSFPFDKIKIDRSFVKDIGDGVGSLNIVRAVAAMANGLGMTTTAEGVETEAQLHTVRAEGCTEMQGFLFSKPLPALELERLLWRTEKLCVGSPASGHAA
jgi:diguanylate cyclase (GGDEF)-like protein/PAS domain S-box-containing protein